MASFSSKKLIFNCTSPLRGQFYLMKVQVLGSSRNNKRRSYEPISFETCPLWYGVNDDIC